MSRGMYIIHRMHSIYSMYNIQNIYSTYNLHTMCSISTLCGLAGIFSIACVAYRLYLAYITYIACKVYVAYVYNIVYTTYIRMNPILVITSKALKYQWFVSAFHCEQHVLYTVCRPSSSYGQITFWAITSKTIQNPMLFQRFEMWNTFTYKVF